jgi:hypothetical protein
MERAGQHSHGMLPLTEIPLTCFGSEATQQLERRHDYWPEKEAIGQCTAKLSAPWIFLPRKTSSIITRT